jgi:selenocysteine-specific elongation factor
MDKHLIMGTAGHVDHGKTALITALTGTDCDTHKEEKERGITINLGFAHLEITDEISIGIVDVPGHKDFIKTMVAGAYGIDFVLLVIAADSGIMPQTREHFNILKMLGIRHGLIALNKADLVDEEMLELAKLEIMEFLEGSPLETSPVVAVSSVTGQGIDVLKAELAKLTSHIPPKKPGLIFRMYVDRIFNVRGIGIVVTGSVLEGETVVGQELFLLPGHHDKVRVKNIERHGIPVKKTSAGDRAALNLSGLKYDDFERGMLLSGKSLHETVMIDAVIELFEGKHRIGVWSHHIFHTGTFTSKARIHLITKDELSGGETVAAQIHLEKPAILLTNDRFILRNTSNDLTFGGGIIIDAQPLHHKRRTEKLKRNLETLAQAITDSGNLAGLISLEVRKANTPLTVEQVAARLGKPPDEIEHAIAEGEGLPETYVFDEKKYFVGEAYLRRMMDDIYKSLQTKHAQNPMSETGLDIRELAGKVKMTGGFEIFLLENILKKMLAEGTLKMVGNTFALRSHEVKPDRKTADQLQWLEETIEQAGMQRSAFSELEAVAQTRNIRKGQLVMLLQYLAANDKIFFNGEDVLHNSLLTEIRRTLLRKLNESPRGINEKEFRLLVNGTKKIIQTLISLFVREGIIEKKTFYLHITEKGQEFLKSNDSFLGEL